MTTLTTTNRPIDFPDRSMSLVPETNVDDDDEGYMTPSEDLEVRPPRDEIYYFAMLVFLVEGCLFKVPRYYFEESDVFRAMFELPFGVQTGEGMTDEHPLHLHGVTAKDFRTLLTVLIRLPSARNFENFTKEEWIAVLHLATMWEFTLIRLSSIEKLSTIGMTAVDRISIARREDIPDWLIASHGYLIAVETFPSIHVMEELGGLQFCVKMAEARETVWRRRQQQRKRYSGSWNWADDIDCWYSIAGDIFDLPKFPSEHLNRDLRFVESYQSIQVDEQFPTEVCENSPPMWSTLVPTITL